MYEGMIRLEIVFSGELCHHIKKSNVISVSKTNLNEYLMTSMKNGKYELCLLWGSFSLKDEHDYFNLLNVYFQMFHYLV